MAGTSGFAVVGCVKQDLINVALRVATANLVPAYSFQLPNVVTVGHTSVGIRGVLMLMPPQVTLQTRADDLVSVNVGFAGQLSLTSANPAALVDVILSATVLVGLVSNVATNGNVQQITVGLNLAAASVTAINVAVLAGPPLAPVFNSALTSQSVLNAMTAALQAVPANLVQVTPQGINLPLQIVQTYEPPPTSSIFFWDTLFQMQFAVSRIVARPLDANTPGTGVLVVAVDMSQPVATTGDANSLTDISGPVAGGPTIDYEDPDVAQFGGGGFVEKSADIALLIDSSWISSIVNGVLSPQLAGKFPTAQFAKNRVSFTNSPDCLQISFGNITAALNCPLSPPIPTNVPFAGIIFRVKVTQWLEVNTDNHGYYQGVSGVGVADAVFNANTAIILMINGRQNQARLRPPLLTNDYYGAFVVGTDISLPWWVDVVAIFGVGLPYLFATEIFGLFGVDIFYPTIVANANNSAGQGLQSALGGLFSDQKTQIVAQLPGTSAPDWYLSIAALGASSDVCYSCLNLTLLPQGLGSDTGSYPYLVLTDQPVTDPSTVPNVPGLGFPQRFDGSFNWPPIVWNQPPNGVIGGGYAWDVHNLNPIGVVLKIPPGLVNPQDPTVFVLWTATRTDTNAVLVSQTLGMAQAGALAISIDHASAALQACDGFQITCTMFQVLAGGKTAQIFNSGNVGIGILDHFDRHHPYANWGSHTKFIAPGQPFWNAFPRKRGDPRWLKNSRATRIHRTDYWHGGRRCLVAETAGLMGNPPHHGNLINRAQSPRGINDFNYLDTLPISLSQVQKDRNLARGVLCDYCFFGGPTKTQLRTDFPPYRADIKINDEVVASATSQLK